MSEDRIIDMVGLTRAARSESVEQTAQSVVDAIKAAGVITLMPSPHLPLTGIVTMVHSDVYDRVRNMMKDGHHGE